MIKVLVIDDDLKICLFFSELLEQMGHWFELANTKQAARRLFQNHQFDLVLLDLDLADGNGLDLLPEFTGTPHSGSDYYYRNWRCPGCGAGI